MKACMHLLISIYTLTMSTYAMSALIDRGNGMIYDSVLDVTWLQDANMAGSAMSQFDANEWAQQLDFGGFNDWRLPTMTASAGLDGNKSSFFFECGNGRFNMDASGCDFGWTSTSTSHELAYMFYANLGNLASFDSASEPVPGGGLVNTASFVNIQQGSYWYMNDYDDDEGFFFATSTGGQYRKNNSEMLFAWALRDGDIASLSVVSVNAPHSSFFAFMILMFGFVAKRRSFHSSGSE